MSCTLWYKICHIKTIKKFSSRRADVKNDGELVSLFKGPLSGTTLRSSYDKLMKNFCKSYEMLRKVSKINLRKS